MGLTVWVVVSSRGVYLQREGGCPRHQKHGGGRVCVRGEEDERGGKEPLLYCEVVPVAPVLKGWLTLSLWSLQQQSVKTETITPVFKMFGSFPAR